MEKLSEYLNLIFNCQPKKVIISKPGAICEYKKAVLAKKEGGYQLEKYTQTQVFHENLTNEEVKNRLAEIMEQMSDLHAFGEGVEYSIRISKKGKILFSKHKSQAVSNCMTSHNRKKNYILEEGTHIPALEDMGVFTKEGMVVNAMYDKFRQINRFVELVDDAVRTNSRWSENNEKPLRIIDFGCGKSYLTFVLYHYFTEIRKLNVEMTGLDLKADVIKKCSEAARKYGYSNLHFELGNINGYSGKGADMVISLHACDTATDYAIYNAVSWNAGMIFSVPCCQHEINSQIKSDNLSLLTRYGIVKERTSALITDAIRANMLEYCGYKADMIEFVGFEHTPKNILIRAVKKSSSSKSSQKKYLDEVLRIMEEFNLNPTIYNLLSGT